MAEEDSYLSLIPTRKETPVTQNSGGIRYAADLNNPTGLGWNGKTWNSYNSPEEGVKDSLTTITKYLSSQGPMSNVSATPENYIGMWVNGKPETGAQVQKGAYAKALRKQLKDAGIELLKGDIIPNTEEAKQAILKAHIVHENTAGHQSKFLDVLPKIQQTSNETEQDTPNYLSLMQRPAVNEQIEPAEREYKPGFYNPNIVAQGERARAAGGGNLEPAINEIANVIKSMNIEDWKKESLIANMLKYGVGGMPIIGNEAFKQEGQEKLLQTGQAALGAISHPIQTFQDISKLEPGQLIGEMIKGGVYDAALGPATKTLMSGAGSVVKPVVGAVGERLKPIAEQIVADYKSPTHTIRSGLQESFQKLKNPQVTIEAMSPQMAGVGAAKVSKETTINNLLPELSTETQNIIKNTSPDKINLPALETKALEEKHGISLSKGQRSDPSRYADEWNRRGTDESIQGLFANQPQQFAQAFDNLLDKHAPDIRDFSKENLGQIQINSLLQKDQLRQGAIRQAYKDLETSNAGQFPIDVAQLGQNIDEALTAKLKKNIYEDKLGTIKKDIDQLVLKGSMTFDDFENLRSNLADEMRTNQSGSARAAAHILREQLENLPLPENLQNIKPLADKARSLNRERMEVIKTNPAYAKAVKESATSLELEGELASLNAAKFHDTYVKNATPEATRRMIDEIQDIPEAMQAIKAGDILNAKEAAGLNGGKLNPASLNKYLRTQIDKNKFIHSPESAQDLLDLEILSGKVAQPKERVFNYSNSTSALLGELAKQGLQFKGEAALAAATKGVSIPVVGAGKQLLEQFNKRKFAQDTTNPYSGIIQEK